MVALVGVALLWAWYVGTYRWPILDGVDNYAYWSAWSDGRLYSTDAHLAQATYIYSPAFAQLLFPFTLVPWDVFRVAWIGASWAAMVFLLWPLRGALRVAAIVLACYFCLNANADWIVTLSLGLGLRFPAVWALLLLTKVTPGIGIVWFAARREWRSLGIAIGATVGVVVISAVLTPYLWVEWVETLVRSVPYSDHGSFFGVAVPSLLLRLPLALLIVLIGAYRGWPWVLPTAALIAQPDIWGVTVLLFASLPRLYERPLASVPALTERPSTEDRLPSEGHEATSSTPAGVP
jgi:hypothetical protein